VPNIKARSALIQAKPGYIAHLPSGDSIHTGDEWIDLGNTYRVADLAARDALNLQQGDLVKVTNTGAGRYDAFLYHKGEWITQIRGDDAGDIKLNVHTLTASNDSEISTRSISGGGGKVTINADGIVQLANSRLSSSVEKSVGNGGSLTISADFLVQNKAMITAKAVEGNGGSIQIDSQAVLQSGGANLNPIDASSKFGLSGTIELNTPDTLFNANPLIINGAFIQVDDLELNTCKSIRTLNDLNRFKVNKHPSGQLRNAA
jgi:hypothetical protein